MNDMTTAAKWFGRVLILVGLAGYAYGAMNGNASWTALIPGIVGLALMVLGYAAAASEGKRKHLMHAAVLVALLGFLASAGRLLPRLSEFTVSAASLSQIAMALICLLFVILAVRSFIAARSARGEA
jgi:hypothetical protein